MNIASLASRLFHLAAATTLTFGALGAQAQAAWPTKPVKLIVPGSAGASADTLGRVLAEALSERMGQQFVIENRVGAGGAIGALAVAKAAPDGYTLLFAQQDSQVLVPLLKKNVPYDTERDFVPVAKVGDIYLIFTVNSAQPYKTIQDLVADAKARPGKLNFASGGEGGINQLASELLKQRAGIDVVHVPYKGGGPATAALLANEVTVFAGSYTLVGKSIEAGRLRGLAVTRPTRLPMLPAIPTMIESGFPDFNSSAWFGLFGPAQLPASITRNLSDAVLAIAHSSSFKQRQLVVGAEGEPMGPEAFEKFLKEDIARWRAVITKAGITLSD